MVSIGEPPCNPQETIYLAATFRLRRRRSAIARALSELCEEGEVVAADAGSKRGWIRPVDLELMARLRRSRPRRDRGVLLSPFDPLLWDRARVRELFGFEMLLEIFKPAAKRVFGYYCMPVLAADRLIARVDLKADRRSGTLRIVALQREPSIDRRVSPAADRAAVDHAIQRYAAAVELRLVRP